MTESREDPLLKSARREALVCVVVWLVATTYSVMYCWLYGSNRSLDSLTFVLGFPDWIFYGVIVPWLACTAFSSWFCLFFMRDEDLGEAAEIPAEFSGVPSHEHDSPTT